MYRAVVQRCSEKQMNEPRGGIDLLRRNLFFLVWRRRSFSLSVEMAWRLAKRHLVFFLAATTVVMRTCSPSASRHNVRARSVMLANVFHLLLHHFFPLFRL